MTKQPNRNAKRLTAIMGVLALTLLLSSTALAAPWAEIGTEDKGDCRRYVVIIHQDDGSTITTFGPWGALAGSGADCSKLTMACGGGSIGDQNLSEEAVMNSLDSFGLLPSPAVRDAVASACTTLPVPNLPLPQTIRLPV